MAWDMFCTWLTPTADEAPATTSEQTTAQEQASTSSAVGGTPDEVAAGAKHQADLKEYVGIITERLAELSAKKKAEDAELADMEHTGIDSEGGCRGCQREYRISGQTQADFAGGDIQTEVVEQKVAPIDEAAANCIVL